MVAEKTTTAQAVKLDETGAKAKKGGPEINKMASTGQAGSPALTDGAVDGAADGAVDGAADGAVDGEQLDGDVENLPADVQQIVQRIRSDSFAARERKSSHPEMPKKLHIWSFYGYYENYEADSKTDIEVEYLGSVEDNKFDTWKLLLDSKHILCEEPLTFLSDHSSELVKQAELKEDAQSEASWGLFFPAYHQLREEERKGSFADSKLVAAILAFKDSENILHRRGSIPDKYAKIENVGGYIVNFCLAVYTAQDPLEKTPSGNNLHQLDPVQEESAESPSKTPEPGRGSPNGVNLKRSISVLAEAEPVTRITKYKIKLPMPFHNITVTNGEEPSSTSQNGQKEKSDKTMDEDKTKTAKNDAKSNGGAGGHANTVNAGVGGQIAAAGTTANAGQGPTDSSQIVANGDSKTDVKSSSATTLKNGGDAKRILIVSNRLPVKITRKGDDIQFASSEGGLATGLGTIYQSGNNLWIGWPGAVLQQEEEVSVTEKLEKLNLRPVFLTDEEITYYYEGFSNETLWPLFHYFPTYATYQPKDYDFYESVNRKFADAILAIAEKDDIIWIHDYQLLLVPHMIRQALPEVTIGYFNHIPFPSFELFRLIPWRKELLKGMLGADVIGFHTYDDVRHFISTVIRIKGAISCANELTYNDRIIAVDAFPISIDYKKYQSQASDIATRCLERELLPVIPQGKHLLSIDRLDYSKGITQRLQAFEVFLERYPEWHGKMTLMQLVVPSRDTVPQYKELKEEINRRVSDINGKYGTLTWQPIQHFYRSFPLPLLSAMYKIADVALVSPMRDGMNLVCKEYVASRTDGDGVLILSEMAGASRELSDAILINPNDIWAFAQAIHEALSMPEDEQRRRMSAMQATVSRFDIHNWVANFMAKLSQMKKRQEDMRTRVISASMKTKMIRRFKNATERLIILDYDGTLVGFQKRPEDAKPDAQLIQILKDMVADKSNAVLILSGRDHHTLEQWMGNLGIAIIAEHGAWYKEVGGEWKSRNDIGDAWKDDVRNVMTLYANRTPGTFIEEKTYSLAWHYRKAEVELGQLRVSELTTDLRHHIADRGLQVLHGDKVLEVKSVSINKGTAARRWLEKADFDFILAAGDDYTDEDTFKAMPPDAITIKVGKEFSAATYFLANYKEVRALLQEFTKAGASQ